ncbi:MAG: class I SAM-dependent methyltransferase [archaeon]|nr:class I SAM-dependent methyltransferase [archaeon]
MKIEIKKVKEKMNKTEKDIEKMYNKIAIDYDKNRTNKKTGGTPFNEYTEMPASLKLLGNIKGKKILDLGCGSGLYVKKLKQKGAKIKGIDISKELIAIAKKSFPKIEFKVGTISKKLPYKTGEFDIVLGALVMHYLDNWNFTLKEIKRVLKPKGIFIFSTENPYRTSLKRTVFHGRKFKEVEDYFNERLLINNIVTPEGKNITIKRYRKTYETIMKYILKNNFEILDYIDAKPLPKTKKIFPKEYKKIMDLPYFCVWKVKKI